MDFTIPEGVKKRSLFSAFSRCLMLLSLACLVAGDTFSSSNACSSRRRSSITSSFSSSASSRSLISSSRSRISARRTVSRGTIDTCGDKDGACCSSAPPPPPSPSSAPPLPPPSPRFAASCWNRARFFLNFSASVILAKSIR